MGALSKTDIHLEGIGAVWTNDVLRVPAYQRSYAWKEENVVALLQDVTEALDAAKSEYFIGSIVISSEDPLNPEIVDGQQRIATSMIIVAAIRDLFAELGDHQRAAIVDDKYISEQNLSSLEKVARIRLNEVDHPFFQRYIVEKDHEYPAKRESNERIKAAYQTALDFVRRFVSTSSVKHEKLNSLVDFIRQKLLVIKVSVQDQTNAYTIFETLNDRGIALSVADLLKNFLFGKAKDKLQFVQLAWLEMVNTIEDEEVVVAYIRHYWSAVHGLTREKELFKRFREKVTSPIHAYDMCMDLASHSKIYAGIVNPDALFGSVYGKESEHAMRTINELGLVQIRPLIMSILRNFSTDEVRRSMKLLLSWSVRFLIAGGHRGGTLEKNYSERAIEISKRTITTAQELLTKMNGVVPADDEFQAAFLSASVSKSAIARYYLRALEVAFLNEPEPQHNINEDPHVVTLEHILPQNPSTAWGHIEPETALTYYQRLGNLVLLTRKVNSAIGNNGFQDKKPVLAESKFQLTSIVCVQTQWGKSEIEERQKMLAVLALKAWPNQVL